MTDPYDVVTVGRVGIDLYPEQTGVPLAEVITFRKMLGGPPPTSPSRQHGMVGAARS